jgi:hypothetical protein
VSALEQTAVAIFFCGLLAILVWLLRKGKLATFGWSGAQNQAPGQMEVIARRALTPQHTLHLVSAAGATFLIATHPHGVEIASFPASHRPARPVMDSQERGGH